MAMFVIMLIQHGKEAEVQRFVNKQFMVNSKTVRNVEPQYASLWLC